MHSRLARALDQSARWVAGLYAGFAIAGAGLLLAPYFVYLYFARDVTAGETSLIVLDLVLGGFVISSTGITGQYVGKIFEQVKGRPLYVIDRKTGRTVE